MAQLDVHQQEALEHLQSILGHHNYETEALSNVLQSLDWDIQRATDLLLNESDAAPNDRDRQGQGTPQLSSSVSNSGQPVRGGHEHRSLAHLFFSILYLPIGLVFGLLRFVSGILRGPFLTSPFNMGTNYRVLRQTYTDSRSATRRWITSLEEETGAVNLKTAAVAATGLEGQQSASRRHAYSSMSPAEESKILPDFFDGTYEEVLDICQKEGRVACVVLVSAEHDDVAEFKRSTLTHSGFVRMLNENNFLVWGGDIRDKDAWDAAQKLQATTYPFVAFVALQPRRNHSSNSSPSTPTPVLTVLSRHYGPSVPESGPTSAEKLMHHLEHQLLPRVNQFLTRFRIQLEDREHDRIIREQQDRAFQESANRDRERMQARIRAEQAEAERLRLDDEARIQAEQRMEEEREKQAKLQALRLQFRRWIRRCIVPPEYRGTNGIRVALKLLPNTRVVRTFSPDSTLTELYAFVDTQLLPLTLQPETDPEHILDGSEPDPQKLENYIQSQANDAESWWGFKLVLPYPRREIKWTAGVSLMEAGLKSGDQLVMELVANSANLQHHSDDDYESDDE